MSGFARTLLVSFLIALAGFAALGAWSFYDSSRFEVGPAKITLNTVKNKLARIFKVNSASDQPIPILMYHYIRDNVDQVSDPLGYNLSIPPSEFEQQLKILKQGGFRAVSLKNVVDGDYDAKSVVLTFDDGYKDFILEAYPLLSRYGFTATIFVISDKVDSAAFLSSDDIVFLANRGFEIGAHSATHANLTNSAIEHLQAEVSGSKRDLERLTGGEVAVFSYPAGQYDDRVVKAVDYAGYSAAVTTNNGLAVPKDGLFTLPRRRLKRGLSEKEFLYLLNQ